jgi:hypothetical protein
MSGPTKVQFDAATVWRQAVVEALTPLLGEGKLQGFRFAGAFIDGDRIWGFEVSGSTPDHIEMIAKVMNDALSGRGAVADELPSVQPLILKPEH